MARPHEKRSPGCWPEASGKSAGEHRFHVQDATAEPLLQRLDRVQKSGSGWRARCPACEGRSRKLSVTESDGRVLVHCFGGCEAIDVLQAVGLTWADVMPPRTWPQTPEERRRARRAIREAGWSAALSVLSVESTVVLIAARELYYTGGISVEDGKRLRLAVDRIGQASATLVEVRG